MVMKKNMMRRNLQQSILKSIGRYIAIMAIIALGASLFVGLLMTKSDMVATGQVYTDEQNMKRAAQTGFINATDLADYLVKKGLPFRSAYKISGQLVALCISQNTVLEELPLDTYQQYSQLFQQDLYQEIDLVTCVEKRISEGGTSVASVKAQIAYVRDHI